MRPIIKWAGGKTQLLSVLQQYIPQTIHHYFEPFFGGGALCFFLAPEHAVLNDINPFLINLYRQTADDVEGLMHFLDDLSKEYEGNPKHFYYQYRERYNQLVKRQEYTLESAALFLFLNKTCFNGLYRVNASGEFNVPFGKKEKVVCYQRDNMLAVSDYLKSAALYNGDFEKVCAMAKEGDFVFLDPPYHQTFEKYQKDGFGEEKQRQLAKTFDELVSRGVSCVLTNSNTELIWELYHPYPIQVLPVKRMINRNGQERTGEEVIVLGRP